MHADPLGHLPRSGKGRNPKPGGFLPARPFDKGCTPNPRPFDKGCTPPTLTIWSGHPNGQGLDPPNPSRLGAATQMDKGLTPPTLHDLERLRKWTRV